MESQTLTSETKTDVSYRILGKTQFERGDMEAASQSYRQAIELNPKQPTWVYQHLANIFSRNNQIEEAIKIYQYAIELQPKNSSLYRGLAKLQAQKGNREIAISKYRKAIELEPEQPSWVYRNLGNILNENQQIKESITAYQKAIKLEPENTANYRSIAKSQFQQGSVEEAILSYSKAIELEPEQPSWVYDNLTKLLKKQERLDQASQIYYQLGQFFTKKRNWKEAIASYYKAIEIKSDFYKAYLNLGDVYRYQEELDLAISCYIKVIEIIPQFRDPYSRLQGLVQKSNLSLEQLDKICTSHQELVDTDRSHILAYQNLSDAFGLQGKIQEAMKYNQKLAQKNNLISNPEFVNKHWGIGSFKVPNFLIMGFAKCGTTSLYDYTIQHPQIVEAARKEIRFFDQERLFRLGIDWYKSNFPAIQNETSYITGEATPVYIINSTAIKRIRDFCPNIKLILILRNPIERAFSQHYFRIRKGEKYSNLEESILKGIAKIEEINKVSDLRYEIDIYNGYIPNAALLSPGLYIYFIEKLMEFFPRQQLLVLHSEELSNKPDKAMNKLFDFLDVPNYQITKFPRKNTGSYTPEISNEVRQQLSDFFRPYNHKLEKFLGMKLDWE
ncbi:MAG: tetratricopeptide repeat protein [Pleurocapsa sp.]